MRLFYYVYKFNSLKYNKNIVMIGGLFMKYIFCDLDGTLLQEFHRINEQDIKALQEAQEKGVKISIATGRLDYEVQQLMNKYHLHGYRVSQNGGVVYNDKNEIVHKVSLKKDEVKMILQKLEGFDVLIFFETENEYIVEKKIKLIEDFEKTQPFLIYIEKPNIMETLEDHDIVTISIWADKNENIKIKKHLDQVLPQGIASYISSQYTIDVTSAKNSKGFAINHLAKQYHIDAKDIAVIGDSHNDISMFELTENSFVMSNADEAVKITANYVVDSVKEAVDIILNK